MTDLHKKTAVLHQLSILADQVDERWPSLTNSQVNELDINIEAFWKIVCRRKAR